MAILDVQLSAYGQLNKKWTGFLIGSGVEEGTVEAYAVYAATASVPIALAVAAEEIGQEALTWGGSSYFFNKRFEPVVLEARLTRTTDDATIWSDIAYAGIDEKQLAKLPKAEQDKREVQLRVTSDKAIAALVGDLQTAANHSVQQYVQAPNSRASGA